jgi:hypothetical protein
VPVDQEWRNEKEVREIEGFRSEGSGARRAGKSNPSNDAGLAPHA